MATVTAPQSATYENETDSLCSCQWSSDWFILLEFDVWIKDQSGLERDSATVPWLAVHCANQATKNQCQHEASGLLVQHWSGSRPDAVPSST